MSDIAARIERIPLTRFICSCFSSAGSATPLMAWTSRGGLRAARPADQLVAHQREVGLLGSSTYVGFFCGALFAGLIGDAIGRKAVMMWALVIYCVASVASAFTDYWPTFLGCRVVAGIGTGAESAIIAPFLTEFVAGRYSWPLHRIPGRVLFIRLRGRRAARLLHRARAPGGLALGARAHRRADRNASLVAASPTGIPALARRAWSRTAEAEAVVADMEQRAQRGGYVLGALAPVPAAPVDIGAEAVLLRQAGPAMGAGSGSHHRDDIGDVGIDHLQLLLPSLPGFPSLLVASGMTITRSFGYSIAIYLAQIPGYFSAAWMNEKIGRQATIASYMILGGVSAIGLAVAGTDSTVMLAGICLSFFMNGTYAGVYAYTPELFPTEVRATGMGTASSIGRIGAIVSPVLVGWLYPHFGFAGVFGTTTAVLVIGALAVIFMGINTRNRSLEDITAEELVAEPTA